MNFDKLFKAIDLFIGVREMVTDKKDEAPADTSISPSAQPGIGGSIERTLTNVLVAALKEAFERDHARLELERTQLEEEKRRAEEAMRLEMRRRAIDRELGRLRLLAATALVGWIVAVILLVIRIHQAPPASTAVLALGCLSLLGSLGAGFSAQGKINAHADITDRPENPGGAGVLSLWLLLAGLALSAASLLL